MPPLVLAVDDEAPLCDVTAAVMAEADYVVAQAHHGHDALQQLIVQPPQLILLDVLMPAMSGTQLSAVLCQTAFTIAVVFMGDVPPADAEPVGNWAAGYLRKPSTRTSYSRRCSSCRRSPPAVRARARGVRGEAMHGVIHRPLRPLSATAVLATLLGIAAWSLAGTAPGGMSQTLGMATGTATPIATLTTTPTVAATSVSQSPIVLPPDDLAIVHTQFAGGGGGTNNVNVVNQVDDRLRLRGSIQLNRILGPHVAPRNDAEAHSTCTNCQTIALALQIDLVSRTATDVAPQNIAVATNYQCSHCITLAVALQYVIPVDDPTKVPDAVVDLIRVMDDELKTIEQTQGETLTQAVVGIDNVIAQFGGLAQYLFEQRDIRSN